MSKILLESKPKNRICNPSLKIKAPAKLNLYFNVLGKRDDGYHDICSIMQRISFFDEVLLEIIPQDQIKIACNLPELNNTHNLAYKAAAMLKQEIRFKEGVCINLHKNIPPGTGLGGASSDCAAVLLGLNRLLRLNLSKKQLFSLGSRLGADVNFFLSESKFARAYGKGENILPIDTDLVCRYLLILTGETVSTRTVYEHFNLELTKYIDNAKLVVHSLISKDIDLLGKLLFNSLTKPYLELSKKARSIFKVLSELDHCPFFVSGSGSAMAVLIKDNHIESSVRNALKEARIQFLGVTTF